MRYRELLESKPTEFDYFQYKGCWVDDKGSVRACSDHQHHTDIASAHFRDEIDYPDQADNEDEEAYDQVREYTAVKHALAQGWIRIGIFSNDMVNASWNASPTPAARKAAIAYISKIPLRFTECDLDTTNGYQQVGSKAQMFALIRSLP